MGAEWLLRAAIQAQNTVERNSYSRDDRIRTCGPFVPNEVRYQDALHPDEATLEDDVRSET